MRIFSNFDTRAPLEDYKKALEQYGADKVMFFRRDRIYLIFYVLLPFVALLLLLLLAAFAWWNFASEYFPYLFSNILFSTLFSLIAFVLIVKILFGYINYLLDYTIVTPHLITSYNQTGLFKREVRTLDSDKIKAITISGNSLISSLFNYGSLIFLSEGDEEDQGDIRLHFLKNPSRLKDEVVRVINLAKDLG